MLASIIFTAVAVITGLNAHPPPDLPPAPVVPDITVAVSCTHWVGTEKCVMNNMKKYGSVYDFEKDVHMKSHHHMIKHDNDHVKCMDKGDWWVMCPKTHDQLEYCDHLDKDSNAMSLKNCRLSCQQCGEDAFLTAEKKYAPIPLNKCAEFAHNHPHHCVKPATEMSVQLGHIFALYKPSALCDGSTDINYCVEFVYRRRGSRDPDAKKFTEFTVCEQVDGAATNEKDVLHEELVPTCEGAHANQVYASHDNCVYDSWFRATYQFHTILQADNECDHYRRIVLEVKRGVDFFDIDNFHVYEGLCHNNAGDNLTPGDPINVELVPKPE